MKQKTERKIQFCAINMLTQQPKGQLQGEHKNVRGNTYNK
jgi:hypothetical protein